MLFRSDGILNDLSDLDILVFHMSKKEGVEIPLLCMPHSYKWNGRKSIFASFIGKRTHSIREHVFNIKDKDFYISEADHNINDFCDIIAHSLFGLCPRGYGLNSFRIAECMQYETIPVYISDEFIMPFGLDFSKFGVIIPEKEVHNIHDILKSYNYVQIIEMQEKISEVYKEYFTYEGAFNNIKKTLLNENFSNS